MKKQQEELCLNQNYEKRITQEKQNIINAEKIKAEKRKRKR